MTDKKTVVTHLLPEGRLINHSLFILDQFNEKSKPVYNVELAYPRGTLDAFFNTLLDFAVEAFGASAESDETLILPILDGDKHAARRVADGKPGDAYVGMDIIRAKTIYNRHGEEGPGGIQVFLPDLTEVSAANQGQVYQGSFGQAAVTISSYVEKGKGDDPDRNALNLYLSAYQKTKDGDRLVSQKDHSSMFQKHNVAPAEGAAAAATAPAATATGSRRKG